MKRTLCLLLIGIALSINSQAFAFQNYIHTTTRQQCYNASSPVGHFANYSATPVRYYDGYDNISYAPTASVQDIYIPQNYNNTVTMTEQMIDTRESADKIIDRSFKVVGGLALAGLVTGIIIHAVR